MKNFGFIILIVFTFSNCSKISDEINGFGCDSKGKIEMNFENLKGADISCVAMGLREENFNKYITIGLESVLNGEPTGPQLLKIQLKTGVDFNQLKEKCYEFKNFELINGDDIIQSLSLSHSIPHPNGVNHVPIMAGNGGYIKLCINEIDIEKPELKFSGIVDADFTFSYESSYESETHKLRGAIFEAEHD